MRMSEFRVGIETAASAAHAVTPARLQRLLEHLALDVGNLRLRLDAVREACAVGQWATARTLIDTGLSLYPGNSGLLAHSGFVYLQAQRYVDAEQSLAGALAQGLKAPELLYNLAFSRFMQKRYAEALAVLDELPTLRQVALALVLRARCLHHLDRRADAIADCRSGRALAPADADANGLLALLLYDDDKGGSAQRYIETALAGNPLQLDALLARAALQADAGEIDAAQHTFEALLQAHPECGRGWLGLSLIELTAMRLDLARRAIETAVIHMPEHVGSWHVLAWINIIQKEVPAAASAFDRALLLDRSFGETHGGLAVVAALEGRTDDARAGIKRALRLNPGAMSPHYARTLLLNRDGQYDEARSVVDDFLARPVPRSNLNFRDLVAAHMRYLCTPAGPSSHPIVLH
jgi:tetratricopeptide (TPR) repeat protein